MSDDTRLYLNLPFHITVCGIEELAGHAERQVSHVLSILDPDHAEPEAFGAYGEHAKLELRFHDVIEENAGGEAPQAEHVEQILTFGRDILRDPEALRHLLVHCHMGISRSTAAMTLLLAQSQPDIPARQVLHQILAIRERAWPNLRMLSFGEDMLGRKGEFSESVGEIYRIQLDRKPGIREFFLEVGRGREVQLADEFIGR
ncbi:MAG: protein-tyrosine-phosphatase [Rhodomicrobium sp.]|nr:protein-tyrosine-phosphatase [Rhodomicrobium sp.]